jgi:hypothetical protein
LCRLAADHNAQNTDPGIEQDISGSFPSIAVVLIGSRVRGSRDAKAARFAALFLPAYPPVSKKKSRFQ